MRDLDPFAADPACAPIRPSAALSFGDDLLEASARLSRTAKQIADEAQAEDTRTVLARTLAATARQRPGEALCELRNHAALRIERLGEAAAEIDATGHSLTVRLDQGRSLLSTWSANPDRFEGALEHSQALTWLQGKLAQLEAARRALQTCRRLVDQSLAAERLVADQIGLARDATVPLSLGAQNLTGLARAAEAARPLQGDIDHLLQGFVRRDAEILRRGRKGPR